MKQSQLSQKWSHLNVALILSCIIFLISEITIMESLGGSSVLVKLVVWGKNLLLSAFLLQQAPTVFSMPSTAMFGSLSILILSTLIASIMVWKFRVKHFNQTDLFHIRGPRLLKGSKAIHHFKCATKREGTRGLFIHPSLQIPLIKEVGNFLIWGMQGAGKSNLIKSFIKQILQRKDRALIYDIKGEYTELFLVNDCLLLSPKDERSINWNLGLDITDVGLAEVFAEAVISSNITKETFWVDSARVVLIGVIVGLIKAGKPWSWAELSKHLFCKDEELLKWLGSYPQAATFIKPEDKTTASIRSMIATQLSWVKTLAELNQNSGDVFSIGEWLKGRTKKTLIVQGDLTSPLMSSALITTLLAILTNKVLSQPDTQTESIWLILDELATLNKSKRLETWLALGRSKGCKTIAGVQLLSQLESIYGKEDANTVLGLFGNVVTFKLAPTGDSAEKASDSLGKRRVEYQTATTNEKGEKSNSQHQEDIAIVKPEDLIHLPQPTLRNGIEGFALISGTNAVYRLNWPINEYKKVADAVIKKLTRDRTPLVKTENRLNRRGAK
ncbi:type IV secretion system DNA-binding domain-containing protein [Pseudoalteromonas sp. M58]|uniref:type IV secretion system DNA-binding domain-containing protein n=1 Tax=Pseudoalteromonas sp. M58 TaxID=3141534 RepID=UPI00366C5B5E